MPETEHRKSPNSFKEIRKPPNFFWILNRNREGGTKFDGQKVKKMNASEVPTGRRKGSHYKD